MDTVCKMTGKATAWPCQAPGCPLYGDCLSEYTSNFKPPVTNADRIRAMSGEKLASELSKRAISTICDIVCQGECNAIATLCKTSGEVCKEIILRWIQQLAAEET